MSPKFISTVASFLERNPKLSVLLFSFAIVITMVFSSTYFSKADKTVFGMYLLLCLACLVTVLILYRLSVSDTSSSHRD